MARPVSIRRTLLANLLLVVVLLSGGIFATSFLAARQTVQRFSRATTGQALAATTARLEGFFAPVDRALRVLGRGGERGLMTADDPDELDRILLPLLEVHPQVTAAMLADSRGREYMLMRQGDGWSSRLTRRDEWGQRVQWREWKNGAQPPDPSWREVDYDPRRRPWFRGAIERPDAPHWTEPYTFFTSREPGITASTAYDAGDGVQRVVALDVLLVEITRFTTGLRVTKRSQVSVTTEDFRVVGLPSDPRFVDPASWPDVLLRRGVEIGLPVVVDGAAAFESGGLSFGEPFPFASGGETWWGEAAEFPLSAVRSLVVAVAIPESDLLGPVNDLRLGIIGLTLVVVGIAVLRAFALARRTSEPIEALARRSERMGRGDLEAGEPISSDVREVQGLARSQEEMRKALRSLMKVGRDLQLAREIQQRALPEELPALPGIAIAAWSEPAEETGGDCYDVIGFRWGNGSPVLDSQGADHALLLMADATGHGVGPALSVTQVRAMLRMAARDGADLAAIARHLNEQLAQDLPAGRFVTCWLGLLDARRHELTSFSAGQAPLLLYTAAAGSTATLEADAPPLGVLEAMDVAIAPPRVLEPGDVFAALSDGVFEATDPERNEFGIERVLRILGDHASRGPDAILATLRAALDEFTRGEPAGDDRTALLIQRVR